MENVINNRTNGVEYSELQRNLRKEVSEQNVKTAQLPQSSLADYLDKRVDDEAVFSSVQTQKTNVPDIEKLREDDVVSAVTSLLVSIRQNSSSAYSAQNNLLANRLAALFKS
jgi:hypothetical protein